MAGEIGRITVERVEDRVSVVVLSGEHDVSNVSTLEMELRAVAPDQRVVVDLTDATFIDSSVVRAIIDAVGADAVGLARVVAVTAPTRSAPRRLIDLVGFSAVVPVFDDRDSATAHANGRRVEAADQLETPGAP